MGNAHIQFAHTAHFPRISLNVQIGLLVVESTKLHIAYVFENQQPGSDDYQIAHPADRMCKSVPSDGSHRFYPIDPIGMPPMGPFGSLRWVVSDLS